MAQRQLHVVLGEFQRTVRQCRRFAADAHRWSLPGSGPRITATRRDLIVEMAFLRGFLGWESFLEESFILHMLGKKPRRGKPPHRYVLPPNRRAALDLTTVSRAYVRWEAAGDVADMAARFFRDGRPYKEPLQRARNSLDAVRTLRNAIAHRSENARTKFEALARSELGGALPPNLTVGGFLNTTRPSSTPPQSFLEHYLGLLGLVAELIIKP